jgi:hypothetical protein
MFREIDLKRVLKKGWYIGLLIPILALAGFLVWALTPLGPMPEAMLSLRNDSQVRVVTKPWLEFHPVNTQPATGVIFYPGGRVDPSSYAPAARAIAMRGYIVVIVPMPLNLAVFAPERAAEVMNAFPEIRNWALGGHSLGGSMAVNFVHRNPESIKGLYLWAAYPASNNDLSTRNLEVVSVYGTWDGVATVENIEASAPLLPANTRWVPINKGNHSQFGWYGDQPGDNPAGIDRESQQEEAVVALIELLSSISE